MASQIEELLKTGLIGKILSPCVVPTVLAPKKEGTWRLCIDSRALNKITIRYIFPMPRIEDLLDCLGKARYFSNFDLKSGYHQIRIRLGDEWKTKFKKNERLYEWKVMSFGLSNAPSTFMRLMNEVLKYFTGKFVIVYLDDILVFSDIKEENLKHIDLVLRRLQEEKLMIKMDQDKVNAILSWPIPRTIAVVRSFNGLATFYKKFIRNFSLICAPILNTIKGGQKCKFFWIAEASEAFEILKQKVAQQLVLAFSDFGKVFQIECDASNIAIGGVLSQEGRPIAFFSEKINEAKHKYSSYDLEMHALVQSLKKSRQYLLHKEFIVYTNNQALSFINSQEKLNHRHMKWVETLQAFTFSIKHKRELQIRLLMGYVEEL